MARDRFVDDAAFRLERGTGDTCSGAGPHFRVAAEQPAAQRRRCGGVADAHLAERQHVDPRLDRHHPVGHRLGAFFLAHRRLDDDVAGRRVEVHLIDLETDVEDAAELVDRGAAGDEVLHHLRGHRGRIGRNAARGDAVIAGEDQGARMVEPRRVPRLPGGEPDRQLLEPAESAGGLGQLRLAGRRRGAGLEIGARQMGQQRADLIQICNRLVHRLLLLSANAARSCRNDSADPSGKD